MPRVLITGVAGFTGRYLAPVLAGAGFEVHGTVHGEAEDVRGVSRLHPLDIGDAGATARLIAEISPRKVVHLAAISFVAHSDVGEMYRSNILGTRNLLEALATARVTPDSVLLASSANVYGNARGGVLDETLRPAPANDYGLTKAAGELLAALYANRLPIIVVRPFNYTGRGQATNFIIPKIVSHVRNGAKEVELGNLEVARDFSDVRDVVDAYARLLEAPQATGETFNVCSGKATSLLEVLEIVTRIAGRKLEVRVNPAFARRDEVKTLQGSRAKLESVVGRVPTRSLDETVRWMLET